MIEGVYHISLPYDSEMVLIIKEDFEGLDNEAKNMRKGYFYVRYLQKKRRKDLATLL